MSTQLLWLDWQLRRPVKRRLGLLQYNWDIRLKPMSTHWGRVTHICVSKPSHYWTLDNGLAPIQCQALIWSDIHCLINCTLRNKRCNFNQNLTFFIQEIAFENFICKIAYILHLHQYVQSNLAKFRLSRTPIFVVESFSNFQVAQNSALIQPYSVQNFKMIWQLTNKLRQSNISLDYGDP